MSGVQFNRERSVSVGYWTTVTWQNTATDDRWTKHPAGGENQPEIRHSVTRSDGAWSDVGYTETHGDPYYLREEVLVRVWSDEGSLTIGQGTASCVYADHGSA